MAQDSHVMAETPAADLAIVAGMVDELEEYIVNEDLYRTVIVRVPGSGDVKLQMTGGELLTRLYRLSAERARLSASQQAELDRLTAAADHAIYSLKSRFHARLQREFKGRLDSLKWFLDEAAEEPLRGRANYPYEIRNRQRIEEIVKQLGSQLPEDLATALVAIDRRLRSLAIGSEFVWHPSLREVFPPQPYWYLYATV